MNLAAMIGVFDAGLTTMVLPAATGPMVIPARIASGKFHGGMATPAPMGTNQDSLVSPGKSPTGSGSAISNAWCA